MTTLLLLAALQVPQADTVTLGSIISLTPAPVEVAVTHEPVIVEVTHEPLDSATLAALADVARQAAMDAAGLGADETPTWERVAWIGVGIAAVWVIGHGLNKIARAIGPDDIDVDVDVDGDAADQIIINVPPPEPPPPPSRPPWGRGKGHGPGG